MRSALKPSKFAVCFLGCQRFLSATNQARLQVMRDSNPYEIASLRVCLTSWCSAAGRSPGSCNALLGSATVGAVDALDALTDHIDKLVVEEHLKVTTASKVLLRK